MANDGTRQDQYAVSLIVDSVGDTGIWDKWTGGEADSEETVYKPGNMGERESLGGFKTVGNVTLSRNFKLSRDIPLRPKLLAARGERDCTAIKQTLDRAKRPVGAPLIVKGTFKRYTDPEVDSESTDASMVEVEITGATTNA